MGIRVIKPGAFTTVQDNGRYGSQRFGVPVSGSMDRYAAAVANILCGNSWDAALLEICFHGTKLFFDEDHIVTFTGGGARAFTEEGEELPINRTIFIPQFSVIDTCYHPMGGRLYMAIDGGVDVPVVMNSRGSYAPAGADHQLKDKGVMRTLPPSQWGVKIKEALKCKKTHAARWWPVDAGMNYYSNVIRVTRGPEWDRFDASSQQAFFRWAFAISRNSDRMGYRLDIQASISESLSLKEPFELISTAVTKGTVQVTHEGSPMVLMSDAQTTGGYPRIAQVIAADLPLLAQKKPAEIIVFEQVSAEKAEELYLRQVKELLRLEKNLRAKFLS